jgi:hypothetical protein
LPEAYIAQEYLKNVDKLIGQLERQLATDTDP